MQDVKPQDQRAVRRFTLQLPVNVTAKSGKSVQAVAESRDVSSHGICFYCDTALEAGATIEFTLTLPAQITMMEPLHVRCTGKVVRVENRCGGDKFAVAAAIDDYEFVADGDIQETMNGADAPPTV